MGGEVLADFKGLVTAPGGLLRAAASCVVLTNLRVAAPGIISTRRGFTRSANGYGGPAFKVLNSRLMGSSVLVHFGSAASGGTGLRYGDGTGAAVALAAVDAANISRASDLVFRMDMALNQRNHYLTANGGVMRLESNIGLGVPVRYAGMPRGEGVDVRDMDPAVYAVLVGAPGTALADGYARAYRVTWHRTDVDGVELGGAPTTRTTIRNQAGTSGYAAATVRDCVLRLPLPPEWGTYATALTTVYQWRLWGTRSWNAVGGEVGDDECFLVAQGYLTAPDITAGYVATTDSTPDAYLVGAPRLHTNAQNFPPGEEGIRQGLVNADEPPPYANCVATHHGVTWFANTELRSFETWTLLSVGGGAGLVAGDTITVVGPLGSVVLTGVAGAPVLATDFTVVVGLATVAMNIEATARNIVACANRNAAGTGARFYHVSTGLVEPGLISVQHAKPGGQLLALNSSRATCWRQGSSGQEVASNRVYFSKPGRADAVPPINFFDVATQDARILRLMPYRERLLVFTDAGIYQVTGRTFADFAVQPLDLTFRLLAPETVCACDDKVYAWCFEGIVEVDDGGVSIISTPIEPRVAQQAARYQTETATLAFAVGYRTSHEVRFFYPSASHANLRQSNFWLAFDTRTRAWAVGFFAANTESGVIGDGRSSGVVRLSDDRLALVNWNSASTDSWLFVERAMGEGSEFVDVFSDNSSAGVTKQLAFQFATPHAAGLVHWQQCRMLFDMDAGNPTLTTVGYSVDLPVLISSVVVSSSGQSTVKTEVPRSARRTTSLRVTLTNTESLDFRLTGLTLTYGGATTYARRPA